jgi:hypothetical protein
LTCNTACKNCDTTECSNRILVDPSNEDEEDIFFNDLNENNPDIQTNTDDDDDDNDVDYNIEDD